MEPLKISDTIQEFDGLNYYKCGTYFRRKGKLLHRVVYEKNHGDVPKGFHVHHKDADRSNNTTGNLEILDKSKHTSLHTSSRPDNKFPESARLNAAEWHRSPEGKVWHSKQALKNNAIMPTQSMQCDHCGKWVQVRATNWEQFKYCSNNCRSAARRARGTDNEQRVCVVCGSTFTTNKYWSTQTCGRTCGSAWRKQKSGKSD